MVHTKRSLLLGDLVCLTTSAKWSKKVNKIVTFPLVDKSYLPLEEAQRLAREIILRTPEVSENWLVVIPQNTPVSMVVRFVDTLITCIQFPLSEGSVEEGDDDEDDAVENRHPRYYMESRNHTKRYLPCGIAVQEPSGGRTFVRFDVTGHRKVGSIFP